MSGADSPAESRRATALRTRLAASPLGRWCHTRRDLRAAQTWNALDQSRLKFYSAFLREGDLVFDIGANVGNRTKVFRRLGATVVAVEPQPYCQSILRRAFERDRTVVVVPAAVGREEGTGEMMVGRWNALSSLSPEWVAEVTLSQRFGAKAKWDRTLPCKLTTVDRLIAEYGSPAFLKIDVEGYEPRVLEGMHSPVAALSFEFTPECLSAAFTCVDRLEELGMTEFNYSSGESMRLEEEWCGKDAIKTRLKAITDNRSFGDVYARLPGRLRSV